MAARLIAPRLTPARLKKAEVITLTFKAHRLIEASSMKPALYHD
jgi:hypothetical protein